MDIESSSGEVRRLQKVQARDVVSLEARFPQIHHPEMVNVSFEAVLERNRGNKYSIKARHAIRKWLRFASGKLLIGVQRLRSQTSTLEAMFHKKRL